MEISAFLKAVNVGKTKLKAIRTAQHTAKAYTFKVPDAEGIVSDLTIDVYTKSLSCSDFEAFSAIQWDHSVEPAKEVCSRYVAAVIVGACDKKGDPIFNTDHVEFLDDPLNAMLIIELATAIFTNSELNSDSRAEKKPE